ncbi:MAG: anthranilate phosphoribosyltransferase [Anaerolineae bacterium]|nr:anthranilate phosphoribosyltransferase [Thermoflexales bacterium]MDW8408345.1 anthranilate phosphoribosyltransferase [Anaerolineae bacterium]
MIQQALSKLFSHQSLTAEEAEAVMDSIMSGAATPAQIGAYLAALRMKGETVDEIVGSARAMRAKSMRIPTRRTNLVDTCGTGGDRSGTFNISTAAAFVVAGAGAPVAKHGNRAASSQSGSADVLVALGVNITITPEQVGRCIDEIGIGFAFAPTHHPAMKHAAGPRREIGARTIFNLLGPLTNPAGATRQLLGVFNRSLTETIAYVLRDLGAERAMVVSGPDHVDELMTTGVNRVSELRDGQVQSYEIDPHEYGFSFVSLDELGGGTPEFNASIVRSVLEGRATPARHNVVVLNAAAALYVAGLAGDLRIGIEQAQESIHSGRALEKLNQLVEMTNHLAG